MRGLPDERVPAREAHRAVCGHEDAAEAAAAAQERGRQQLRHLRIQQRQRQQQQQPHHRFPGGLPTADLRVLVASCVRYCECDRDKT